MTGVGDSPKDLRSFIVDTRKRLTALERRQIVSGFPARLAADLPDLGPNVDLNTVISTGWYVQTLNAQTSLALNYPVARAGNLMVQGSTAGSDFIVQTYTEYTNPVAGQPARQWRRNFYAGAWTPWYEQGAIGDTGWLTCAVSAGFAQQGSTPPQIRKIGKVVYSRGGWNATGLAAATTYAQVGTLPAGLYAPLQTAIFSAGTSGGTTTAIFRIETNGDIGLRTGTNLGTYYFLNTPWLID